MSASEPARRRREALAAIGRLGPCLPGTVTERTTACASPGCRCHSDPALRHGPYWIWTRKVSGKTVSKNLSAAQAQRYRSWLKNKRRLDELVAELEQLSVLEMADNEKWPAPDDPPPDKRRRRAGA
ncbi:MAG: DUF6788 family protein [Acidimicrobiales bacterium]